MRKIFCALLMTLIFSSCKDFLQLVPTDSLAPENYYKTEAQLNNALTGVYDILGKSGTYGRYLYFEMDVADDSFVALSSWTADVSLYNYSPGDVKLNTTWTLLYEGINRANSLLDNMGNAVSVADAVKNQVRGEALFLRAYYYFILVSNWGDVPLKLEATASANMVNISRTPYKDVYARIVADMEEAATLVKPISAYNHSGRVSQSAIWGILARVNLKMAGAPLRDASRFAEARKWAEMVINNSLHVLNPDYTQVFKNMCAERYDNKESIWEVEFSRYNASQGEDGSLGSINGIGTSNTAIGYSYGAKHTTRSYYNSFGVGDLRRDWNINDYYYTSATDATKVYYASTAIYNRCDAKWRREYEIATPKFNGTTVINFPLLRYSDVLLMFAEADNEVQKGPSAASYSAVNQVRERAYGVTQGKATAAQADLPTGLDYESFKDAVRKERSWELGYEGLRRFDLIRWGGFLTAMKNVANEIATSNTTYTYGARSGQNVSARDTLFAIPSNEISLNNQAVQNPGW